MAAFILSCFVVFILAFIAKLIYEVQQNKKQNKIEVTEALDYVGGPTSSILTPEEVDKFQTLAGIKPHDSQKGTNDLVNIMAKAEEIKKAGFPPQSESIPVQSFPITKIQVNQSTDPLSEIPLSRVSKEGKEKMAEIAKQDIAKQVEVNAETIAKLQPKVETKPKKKTAKPKVTKAAPKKKATKKKKENE